MRGLTKIAEVPDKDQWHAEYDFDGDRIVVQGKLEDCSDAQKIHVLLHEAGHRGQRIDRKRFEAMKRRGLATEANFLSIANKVHHADYDRTGHVDDLAGEVFAESYARFCLDMPMPEPLLRLWEG